MTNFARQDNDISPLLLGDIYTKKGRTVLSGEEITEGMLLGEVKFAVGDVTAGTNTGDGTVTLFALSSTGNPKVGVYSLVCVEAVTNGGIFKLVDPDGITIAQDITIEAGAGGTILFAGQGITFTITDGSTDFALADSFTLEVVAGSGKLKQVVSTSIDGSQIPKYIAISDMDASLADLTNQEVGAVGKYNLEKLVFDGSETINTTVSNKTYYDYLRELGMLVLPSNTYGSYDNA